MSELAPTTWTSSQTRAQFFAILRLRWDMLRNGFRRKGGTGELIGRILLYPVLAGMAFGPSVLVALGAYFFTRYEHLDRIAWLLWAIFAYCQLLNIQLGQPGSTFDPTQLIRFPLSVRNYIYIRLCFGLLTPANVIGSLMSFSIALGLIIAAPALWLYALLALFVFNLANVLFSRMVFSWVDRWLATRRAREIFTSLIFVFSIGIQWLNFTFNPAYNHGRTHDISRRVATIAAIYHRAHPLLGWLPPELTASALIAANQTAFAHFLELTLACALYAAVFFAVFALRMRTEFRGESLSDAAARSSLKPPIATPSTRSIAAHSLAPAASAAPARSFGPSPQIVAILGKELLYLRRHTGILFGLIMPIFLVLMLASKFATRSNAAWVFPAAVAYTLLAVSPLSYNSFGLEGTGSQFYFLAPVSMRDVLLAKNLLGFAMALVEVLGTFAIISYIGARPSLNFALIALLWAAATMLVNTAVGNRRSLSTPKKINPQRMANKQASQLSALIGMGILMASVLIAAVPIGLGLYFHHVWWLVPVFAVFATAALYVYERSLRSLDRYALDHRDQLFEELCKAG